MENLVSVIMPTYNCSAFIFESIESVIKQTYINWELIIIDDNSTDNTYDVIKGFDDKRIRYIKNESNKGAAYCRNLAQKIARGKFIAFLDSDDIWMPDKLELQIRYMLINNYSFVYSKYEKIDEKGNALNIYCTGPSIIDEKEIYKYDYIGCLTVVFDKEKLGCVIIKEISKNNDYAMWLQLCKKTKCYLLNKNLAKYRVRESSISHDSFYKKIMSHYLLYRICDEKNIIESFFLTIKNMFFGFIKKIKYEKK